MKEFTPSKKKKLSKNVFAFKRKKVIILFNRMNFQRKYLKAETPNEELNRVVKKMENQTPAVKFFLPPLKKIRLEVTFKCNCSCDYCLIYKNRLKQINKSMSEKTADKIISFYKKNIKSGSLMIIGAEPFLNWPVVKKFIKNIKDPIKIFTNGTIIDENILKTIKENKQVRLIISLDGKRTHNKKRKFKNGKETYPSVIENIKILQKNGCKLGIACLCTDENINDLYKITKFFVKDLQIKYLGLSFPHYVKDDANKSTNLDLEEYIRQLKKIFNLAVRKGVYVDQIAKRFSPLINKKLRFYACKLVNEQKTFYPNGKETYCTKIDSLENSEKYNLKYFQSALPINNKFCEECPAMGICGGGCFWDGIMRFQNGVDERECLINNSLLDYFLWNLYQAEKRGILPEKKFNSLVL